MDLEHRDMRCQFKWNVSACISPSTAADCAFHSFIYSFFRFCFSREYFCSTLIAWKLFTICVTFEEMSGTATHWLLVSLSLCVCTLLISFFFCSISLHSAKEKWTFVQICCGSDLLLLFCAVFCRSKLTMCQSLYRSKVTQKEETNNKSRCFGRKTLFFVFGWQNERPTRLKVMESERSSEINDVK